MIKTYKHICPNCNKEFWNGDKRSVCCSKSCSYSYYWKKHRAIEYTLLCIECNKEFKTTNKSRLRFKRNFCSMECYNIYKEKSGIFRNKQRKGHKLTEEHKRKCSEALKGKPCWIKGKHHSIKTRTKIYLSSKRGLNSPFYITDKIGSKGYGILFTKQLKEKVRVRDNFICQLCGVPELECKRRLDIHHIDFNRENCNMNNLISLCRSCHSKTKMRTKINYYMNNLQRKLNCV